MESVLQTDVLIIGGGLAGLACAVGLHDSGLRVTVVEQDRDLGGRARSWRDPGTDTVIDLGPHILLSEYRNMLALLDLLGTRDKVVWNGRNFITLVDGARRVPIHMDPLPPPLHMLLSMLKAPVSLRDSNSNASTVFFTMKMREADVLRLDDVPATEFLRNMGVSPRFIEWFWASTAMTIMNVPLEKCSTGALLRFFRILLGHSNLEMGFPGTGLGDLFAPQAERLVEQGGGSVLRQRRVVALAGTEDRVNGVRFDDGTRVEARYCVSAIPPRALRAILNEECVARYRSFSDLAAFESDPYISTYLWFDRKLTDARNWSRVWSPSTLTYDSYDLSNIRLGWRDRPSLIASNIIYSHRADRLSDATIIERVVSELAPFIPDVAHARLLHARVHRIPMAIPCPYPGTEQKRLRTVSPLRGLLLAGDWTQTRLPACMESAVRSGWLAAEHILADIGRPKHLVAPFSEPTGLTGLIARVTGATGWRAAAAV